MTQPSVNFDEIDGALGILPNSSGKMLAVVGTSSSGTVDTPVAFARVSDVTSYFGTGPLCEAAAHMIETYGRPVLCVRATGSVAGTNATLNDADWAGTSVPTLSGTPLDDYEVVVLIVAGGTVGTAGITYKVSYDAGNNYGPITALGTATSIVVTGAGTVALAAGTITAGAFVRWTSSAPQAGSSDYDSALDGLAASVQPWGIALLASPLDGTIITTVETQFSGLAAAHKPRAYIASFRMPTRDSGVSANETEAAYLTAFDTAFATKATTYGEVCAGACRMPSSISGRSYRRPVSFSVAARTAYVSEEVNIADINLGALPVSIRDSNGNVDEHDESVNPGLDDARACVLRTVPGFAGVYVNRPLLLSTAGSDFDVMPKRRVMNIAEEAIYAYLVRLLSTPIRVSPSTGYILEEEALEIESGARAALKAVLGARPKASAWSFTLSRTDNLLSTKTLTGEARVVPLGYPETINITIGFQNPALQVQTV